MIGLTIFANFRINNEERYLRMKDSFESFRNIGAQKWVINIRGDYAGQAMDFLRTNLQELLVPFALDSKEGWLHDCRQMLATIETDYVLNWIEDHLNLARNSTLQSVIQEMNDCKVDYMCYSFFGIHQKYDLIPKDVRKHISCFTLDYGNFNLFQQKSPGAYILSAVAIFATRFFKRVISDDDRQQAIVWPANTPFNFEKSAYDIHWLGFRMAVPLSELFASIDDDHEGPSLISRGLYPARIIRNTGAGGVIPLKAAGIADKMKVALLRCIGYFNPSSILYVGDDVACMQKLCSECGVDKLGALTPEQFIDTVKNNSGNSDLLLSKKFDVVLFFDFANIVATHVPINEILVALTAAESPVLFAPVYNPLEAQTTVPAYWQKKLNEVGYKCHDAIRWQFWPDPRFEWRYFENIFSANFDPEHAGKEKSIPLVFHQQTAIELMNVSNGGLSFSWYLKILKDKISRKLFTGKN